MSKKYVVRIMATVFDAEDLEIENPKPVVLVDFVTAENHMSGIV